MSYKKQDIKGRSHEVHVVAILQRDLRRLQAGVFVIVCAEKCQKGRF